MLMWENFQLTVALRENDENSLGNSTNFPPIIVFLTFRVFRGVASYKSKKDASRRLSA